MRTKGSAPDVATTAIVEWLVWGGGERPRAFPLRREITTEIWRAELWALSAPELQRLYAAHQQAVDDLARRAGVARLWLYEAIANEAESARRAAAWKATL